MTGKELIKWIIDHKAEDVIVEVAYRDEGGLYFGTDAEIAPIIVGKNVNFNMYIGKKEYERLIL